jgi:short-subunit dehydrogenase
VHVTALCPGLTRTEFQSVSRTDSYTTEFPSMVWMMAAEVAEAGLRDVAKGDALSVPGAFNKLLAAGSAVAPRTVVRRISSLVQRG